MSKHTPGPWICQYPRLNRWEIRTTANKDLAVVKYHGNVESAANARLIAAAPDIYEAACNALELLPVGPEKDALVDALLKAEGDKNE